MVGVGTRVGEGSTDVVGVGGGVSVGTSGIGVSTGRVGCSPPQEAKSKRIAKHSNTKTGSLKFPAGSL